MSRMAWLLVMVSAVAAADEPHISYVFPAGGQRGTVQKVRVGGHNLHSEAKLVIHADDVRAPATIRPARKTVWFEGPMIPMPASQRKEDYPRDYDAELQISQDATLGVRRWRVVTSQGVTVSRPFVIGDLREWVEEEMDGAAVPVQVQVPMTINGRIFPREDVDIWTFEASAGVAYGCEVMASRLASPLDARIQVFGPDGQLVAENEDFFGKDPYVRFVAAQSGHYQIKIHDTEFNGLQDYVYRLTLRRETEARTPRLLSSSGPESYTEEQHSRGISAPAVLTGCIAQAGEIDRWRIHVAEPGEWTFLVQAAQQGSSLDGVLALVDADGKQLVEADDQANSVDPMLRFKFQQPGDYWIELRDRFPRRGGDQFGYRVEMQARMRPTFTVTLPSDAITVPLGGELKVKAKIERLHGFTGEIQLEASDLPAGVSIPTVTVPKSKKDVQVTIRAGEEAQIQSLPIQLFGLAAAQGDVAEQRVQARATVGDQQAWTDQIHLAVALPTPFKVVGVFETKYAAQGETYVRHYKIERGGFEGPIRVQLADRQARHLQGVVGNEVLVPPGQSEFDFAIHLAPWMEIGRTSRTCVMAVAEIRDHAGKLHTVSYSSQQQNDQIILLVDPSQLSLKVTPSTVLAEAGRPLTVQVEVALGQGITGPTRIELVAPDHLSSFQSPPVQLSGSGKVKLVIEGDEATLARINMPLMVRATARKQGRPYVAEAKLRIVPR